MKQKIVIVYNADEGFVAMIKDAIHKVVKPDSYPCSLCMTSYSPVAMRWAWRKYLRDLPMEKEFYHRQDFDRAYPAAQFPIVKNITLPVILLEQEARLEIILDSASLDKLETVDELITATDRQIAQKGVAVV